VPLTEGWAMTMARTNGFRRLRGRRRLEAVADRFASHMYYAEDLSELQRLRLPACGKCKGCRKGPGCLKEGRGLAVLDEAHQWLNARTWDADETGKATTKAEAVRRRLAIVKFFATHRHRGWDIELLTQDELNLDRQVRGLFETHTHLKNLKKFKIFGLIPIVPCNVFIAVKTWHDADKTRLGVQSYLLNKKLAACYDTHGAGRVDEDDPDAIYLGNLIVSRELGHLHPTATLDVVEVIEAAATERPDGIREAAAGRTVAAPASLLDPFTPAAASTPKLPRSSEPSDVNGKLLRVDPAPLKDEDPSVSPLRPSSNLRVVTAPDAQATE
jgi:hypothetical protein